METVPSSYEEINMPDLFNKEEMGRFVNTLRLKTKPRGVKQLRICAQIVYRSLCRIERAQKDMQRILRGVNGQATEAQHQYYEEKKVRTAAQRFYSTLSDYALNVQLDVFGLACKPYLTREGIIRALVDAHVASELNTAWAEAAQQAEQSGYIGPEETERVLQSGAE